MNNIKKLTLGIIALVALCSFSSVAQAKTESDKYAYLYSMINPSQSACNAIDYLETATKWGGRYMLWKNRRPDIISFISFYFWDTACSSASWLLAKSLYHLLLNDKKYLECTIKAFTKSPEDFPTEAHAILTKANKNIATMTTAEIWTTCYELRFINRAYTQKEFTSAQ